MKHLFIGLAQQTPSGEGSGAPTGFFGSNILLMVAIFAIFYFLVIRPQAKKAKTHQQMLAALKKGDDVVTSGGVLGKITGIRDDEITLQVQEGVRLRVLRSAISGRQKTSEPAKTENKAS